MAVKLELSINPLPEAGIPSLLALERWMMQKPNSVLPPEMSNLEYEVWREFIQQRCGMYFSENRLYSLRQRLWERMRLRKTYNYSEYYHFVAYNSEGKEEWEELLETLLNQETGFFRHPPSFEALTGVALPELMRAKQKAGVKTITMWSAGCATGQEPYSLAMAFLETTAPKSFQQRGNAIPFSSEQSLGRWQVKVSASDISQRALERARRGRYKPHEVRFMPEHYREKYMFTINENGNTIRQVNDQARDLVQFGQINLHDPATYWISAQDVIFCQNVLIYFNPEKRLEVVSRLCQRLNPGGYLFLAPAEVVGLKLPGIQSVRLTDVLVYQRVH